MYGTNAAQPIIDQMMKIPNAGQAFLDMINKVPGGDYVVGLAHRMGLGASHEQPANPVGALPPEWEEANRKSAQQQLSTIKQPLPKGK